ncbi:RHS repeat domain-containing protein [Pseudobutyrivibrio ruminis]|uniref:RHS repeat domain-containing protein n=1 Tax=Pseudobutyrivibrio ruminis TaxID=46206 RepID=UPI0026EDAD44|nr:RHS repeat-associated core domain-containing protein [Pseudobutyrivibrio ruminis]
MESHDKEGVLDKYFYTYDNTGLISGINRKRRGLDAVSGQYDYKYDAIGRLTESSLNGQVKSAYEYDAFGNRTSLTEKEVKTTYNYDVLDRLVEAKELNNSQAIVKTYDYDKRGNQTKEFVDGLLQKTFTFDATNMLAKVTDATKGELENQYNGLGFRVASTRPEEKIEYLCDLSRDYYNLLERTVNGETESFIYDNNVISMSKSGSNYYYLQDELGSPMYMTGTDGVAVSSYAFDDFGRNIDPRTGKQRKHEYTTNGNVIQPFAFTGYQEDEVSGLKFAQARFYNASTGRFQSEDNVKGFINAPFTLNHYGYCFSNPIGIADNNGNWPEWVNKAGQFVSDHKEIIVASAATVAAVGITVATCGAGAGVAAGLIIAGTGAAEGVKAYKNGENVEKAVARGMANSSVIITSAAVNPTGTILGMSGQMIADGIKGEMSPMECYSGAAFGGAIANSGIPVQNLIGGMGGSLMADSLKNGFGSEKVPVEKALMHAGLSGLIGVVFDAGNSVLDSAQPGFVEMEKEYLTNPLWFLREYDKRTATEMIDDVGRALLGCNGSKNTIMNYLDTYVTNNVIECTDN